MRFHSEKSATCTLCSSSARNDEFLSVVASDADVAALERSGTYKGRYFVLGGTLSLTSEKTNGLRIKQLLDSLPGRAERGLKEVILAFPANPEGDATANRLRHELESYQFKITSLGRGLSTGSELEYADPETLKNALEGRR
jgi:recombination protein RecR